MKKLVIYTFCLILTGYMALSFSIYQLSLHFHREGFREYILKEKLALQIISINPSELYEDSEQIKWSNDNSEIIMGEYVYDVISLKNENGKVLIYAYNDFFEKIHFEQYKKHLDPFGSDQEFPESENDDVEDFSDLEFLNDVKYSFHLLPGDQKMNCEVLFDLSYGFHSILIPPPNCLGFDSFA